MSALSRIKGAFLAALWALVLCAQPVHAQVDPTARGMAAQAVGALRNSSAYGAFLETADRGLNSPAIFDIGDSTGFNLPSDPAGSFWPAHWPYRQAQWFAARDPGLRVVWQRWRKDDDKDYDAPLIIAEGDGTGDRYAWVKSKTGDVLTPSRTTPHSRTQLTADVGALPTIVDITIDAALDSWDNDALQHLLSLGSTNASNAGLRIIMAGDGTIKVNLSTNGTSWNSSTTYAWTTPAAGSRQRIRVVINQTTGLVSIYTSATGGGNDWTLGNSSTPVAGPLTINTTATRWDLGGAPLTGEAAGTLEPAAGKFYAALIRNGALGPVINPQPIDTWLEPYWVEPIYGSRTLYIFNGSIPGSRLDYINNGTRLPTMLRKFSQAIVYLNDGYNESPGNVPSRGTALRTTFSSAVANIRTALPNAKISVMLQPPMDPTVRGATYWHQQQVEEIAGYAASQSLDVVDVRRAWRRSGLPVSALTISGDGLHPSDTGSEVWKGAVIEPFTFADR